MVILAEWNYFRLMLDSTVQQAYSPASTAIVSCKGSSDNSGMASPYNCLHVSRAPLLVLKTRTEQCLLNLRYTTILCQVMPTAVKVTLTLLA